MEPSQQQLRVISLEQIKARLAQPDAFEVMVRAQETAFVAYSQRRVLAPPVTHLSFERPTGDCHVKCGYLEGDNFFLIKVATGFHDNNSRGLPNSHGLMLAMDRETGVLQAVLLDQGYLTDTRTAIAGLIAAKYMAPAKVERIGIIGTGIQARLQLDYLRHAVRCREVIVWGRSAERLAKYQAHMQPKGFRLETTRDVRMVAKSCNLIVTATSSHTPLLQSEDVQPGTHITAVGADSSGKQELDPALFSKAALCVVDSIAQCRDHGESSYALKEGFVEEDQLVEMGRLLEEPRRPKRAADAISIADLTGLAIQDVQIARLFL